MTGDAYDDIEEIGLLYDNVTLYRSRPDVDFYVEEARSTGGKVFEDRSAEREDTAEVTLPEGAGMHRGWPANWNSVRAVRIALPVSGHRRRDD